MSYNLGRLARQISIDSDGGIVTIDGSKVISGAADPTGTTAGTTGDFYHQTTDDTLFVYSEDSDWVSVGGGSGGSGGSVDSEDIRDIVADAFTSGDTEYDHIVDEHHLTNDVLNLFTLVNLEDTAFGTPGSAEDGYRVVYDFATGDYVLDPGTTDSDIDARIGLVKLEDLDDTPDITSQSSTRQVLSIVNGSQSWQPYITSGTVNNTIIQSRGIDSFTVYTKSDGTVLTTDRSDAKYRYKGVLTLTNESDTSILIIRVVRRDLVNGTVTQFDDNTNVTQSQFDGIEGDPNSVTYIQEQGP